MSKEKQSGDCKNCNSQIEEKNCKECLHFEACCKWTDFPKQIGFPVCRKYRKQSEVIDEFVERLKEQPINCGLPLFGLSTKEEIEDYFNGIMLQVRDAIDSIAEAMKGENK